MTRKEFHDMKIDVFIKKIRVKTVLHLFIHVAKELKFIWQLYSMTTTIIYVKSVTIFYVLIWFCIKKRTDNKKEGQGKGIHLVYEQGYGIWELMKEQYLTKSSNFMLRWECCLEEFDPGYLFLRRFEILVTLARVFTETALLLWIFCLHHLWGAD